MINLTSDEKSILTHYMNDPTVLYPQRVRYFFFTCKEQVVGQYRIGIVKRLDQVLAVALLMKEEWHDSFKTVISKAVELNALHSADLETFLSHLIRCIPAKNDKPPARQFRRVGQSSIY